MLIFKIVLLESSEVETDSLRTDGRKIMQADGQKIVQTDGNFFFKYRYLVRYLSNKKRIFKIGL